MAGMTMRQMKIREKARQLDDIGVACLIGALMEQTKQDYQRSIAYLEKHPDDILSQQLITDVETFTKTPLWHYIVFEMDSNEYLRKLRTAI